jgi:hypothetical protein
VLRKQPASSRQRGPYGALSKLQACQVAPGVYHLFSPTASHPFASKVYQPVGFSPKVCHPTGFHPKCTSRSGFHPKCTTPTLLVPAARAA